MLMKRYSLLGVVVAFFIGSTIAVLLFPYQRSGGPSDHLETEKFTDDKRSYDTGPNGPATRHELIHPDITSRRTMAHQDDRIASVPTDKEVDNRIRVKSSKGLELQLAEIQGNDGKWQSIVLSDGWTPRLAMGDLPLRVRAPGHLETVIHSFGGEVMLFPDSLIILQYPDLESRVESIYSGPDLGLDVSSFGRELSRLIAISWQDNNSLAVAVSADQYRSQFGENCVITLRIDANHSIIIRHNLTSEEDVLCHLPIEIIPHADASLTVVVPGSTAALLVECFSTEKGRIIAQQSYAWGTVKVLAGYQPSRASISNEGDEVTFQNLIIGRRYGVSAISRDSHSYAREYVTISKVKSAIELELLERSSVTFTLRSPSGISLPDAILFEYDYHYKHGDSEQYLLLDQAELSVDSDGRVHLVVPNRLPVSEEAPWPPPPFIHLRFRAVGFRSGEHWVQAPEGYLGGRMIDGGVIELLPIGADIVLKPNHGLEPSATSFQRVGVPAKGGYIQFEIEAVDEQDDGSLHLFLRRSGECDGKYWVRNQDGESIQSWMPVDHIAITQAGVQGNPYRREYGGYSLVPTDSYEFKVALDRVPDGSSEIFLGWSWNGIDHVWARISSAYIGQMQAYAMEAPEGTQEIWWSTRPFWSETFAINEGKSEVLPPPSGVFQIP